MLKSFHSDQKGALNLLILIAVIGLLAFLAIVYVSPFKNSLFSALYPKDSSFAAGVVDLSISPETASIETGKTFLVDVVIDAKTEQPTAAEVFINYNPAILEAKVVEKGTFFTQDLSLSAQNPIIDNTTGTVHFTYGQQPLQYKTGLGSVATIEFKTLQPGSSSILIGDSSQIAAIGKTGNVIGLISNGNITITPISNVTKTAQFSFSPASGTITSAEFPVNVMVKNSTDAANLFSARVKFDATKLEVSRIVTDGAFVNQWVTGTDSFNNATGNVSIIGGVRTPGYTTGAAPEKLGTIFFKAKASGAAAVTFDGTSAVYRNLDNVDILLSSTGASFTTSVTTSPSPSPSIAPSPSPSAAASASPGASAAPSPSAAASTTPSASPIASASVPPGSCSLASASWITSANPIVEKKIVSMKVTGTGNCAGQMVVIQVSEDDGVFGTDPTRNRATSPVKFGSTNEAVGSWMAEFQTDGFNGINNPPEFTFTAQLQGNSQTITSASPALQVTQAVPGAPIKGDANRDNKFDLADMSALLTSWNKNTDINETLDTNDDGVINAFDFSYMVQLLKSEGIIQ